MKVGFLFNHDASHQVPHTVPVAAALAGRGVDVEIMTTSEEQRATAMALLPPGAPVRFRSLDPGWAGQVADRVLRHVSPFRRVAVLRANLPTFAGLDALVVPETTSTLLRSRFGLRTPRLVYLPHGAGDGAAGFGPATRLFDLVLLSGRKVRDRMREAGLVRDGAHAIVGYPKFDATAAVAVPRFFPDGRPTVLYNPHFNPRISSWYRWGRRILRFFAAQDRFNLIFAPHVMLFRRLLHVTPIHRAAAWRPGVPRNVRGHGHLRIDPGSRHSVDMSYNRAADIYLGDVSSQVYEWIQRPRPAIFLDPRGIDWRTDPDHRHWRLGEVVTRLAELPAALDRAVADPGRFARQQEAAREDTFSVTDRPAGERAADAILQFMATGRVDAP